MFALFPRDHLAADVGHPSPEGKGFSGVTLAHNVATKPEVAALLALAKTLGAKTQKPAQDVFWGGHSGYFEDLDGHFWEVAFNPFLTLRADGTVSLEKPS